MNCPEGAREATLGCAPLGLAMTVVVGGWWFRIGWAIIEAGRRGMPPPYCTNSIRRAGTSDRSSGPNDLILSPDHQNELAPGPARYAERKLATGRASPKDVVPPPDYQNELDPGPARYAEWKPATGRAGPKDAV